METIIISAIGGAAIAYGMFKRSKMRKREGSYPCAPLARAMRAFLRLEFGALAKCSKIIRKVLTLIN